MQAGSDVGVVLHMQLEDLVSCWIGAACRMQPRAGQREPIGSAVVRIVLMLG